MDSPDTKNKYRKKNNRSNTSITQIQSHTTSESIKSNKNKENNSKGGSVLEDVHREEITTFTSKAGKTVDNV